MRPHSRLPAAERLAPIEVDAVVFDVDHTLGDLFCNATRATEDMLPHLVRLKGDEAAALAALRQPYGGVHHEPARLALHLGAPEAVAERWHALRRTMDGPYPGALPVLQALRAQGAKIFIASNGMAGSLFRRLAAWGLPPELVDGVYVREDIAALVPIALPPLAAADEAAALALRAALAERTVLLADGQQKPSPFALLDIAARHGLQPARIAMVGDSPASDGLAARRAGARFVLVTYGMQHPPEIADRYERVTGKRMAFDQQGVARTMTAETRPDAVVNGGPRGLLNVLQGPRAPFVWPRPAAKAPVYSR